MNKTLRLALALVLCLVMVFALTACEKHDCEKDGHEFVEGVCKHCGEEEAPAGGDLPAGLPVAEGKVTFYFTFTGVGDNNADLASHTSIWLCGPMNYTAESTDFGKTAVEVIRLGETNVYYYQYDVAAVEAALEGVANAGEFQLALGWNASSGVPASSQGVHGSWIKHDQATSGLDNPSWAELYTAGAQTVNLGDVHFSGALAAPQVVENVTFSLELAEALPEGWVVVMPGSHVGWNNKVGDHLKMTPSADRKTWTLTIASIFAGDYNYKLLAMKADSTGNDSGDLDCWDNLTDGATSDNETITISGLDAGQIVALRGEPATFPAKLFSAADATNATITVTFTTALEEGVTVAIAGAFQGWSPVAMTASADRKTFTFVATEVNNGQEFKVIVCAPGVTPGWGAGPEYGAGGVAGAGNAALSFEERGDGITINAFAEPLVYPVPAAE